MDAAAASGGAARFGGAAMLAAIGAVSGVLTGLIGVGGSAVMMALLVAVGGFTMRQAVATTLFVQLIPETIPAALVYYRSGHLAVGDSAIVTVGSVVGIAAGAYLSARRHLSERALMRAFIVTLFGMAAYFGVHYW